MLAGGVDASVLREALSDGSPRVVCDCKSQEDPVRLTSSIHPLQCLPDPCFSGLAAQPHASAEGLGWDMQCRCGDPKVTRLYPMGEASDCVAVRHNVVRAAKDVKSRTTIETKRGTLAVRLNRGEGPLMIPEDYYAGPDEDWFVQVDPCSFCQDLKKTTKMLTGFGVSGTQRES